MPINYTIFYETLKGQGFKNIKDFWNDLKKNHFFYDDKLSRLLSIVPHLKNCLVHNQIKCIAIQQNGISTLEYITEHKEALFSLPTDILINASDSLDDLPNIAKNKETINKRKKKIYGAALKINAISTIKKLLKEESGSIRICFIDMRDGIFSNAQQDDFYPLNSEARLNKMALSFINNNFSSSQGSVFFRSKSESDSDDSESYKMDLLYIINKTSS